MNSTRPAAGFTLLELLIVMVIIGIIIAFILTAALDGVRRAEERGTQALITKLEAGMADRVDALLNLRTEANSTHAYLAGVWNSSLPPSAFGDGSYLDAYARAQIIARFDQIKAELPDVFVVQKSDPLFAYYPLNFVAAPYDGVPSANITPNNLGHYLLPTGAGVYNNRSAKSYGSYPPAADYVPPSYGIFGASYTAAGGLYKSLFLSATRNNPTLVQPKPADAGYDGADNNGNGLVDEIGENGAVAGAMVALLDNHTHKTARSEMLYALLVNGQGPLGSVFSPDEFSDREVRDTDGDGLPEFVDAWGEPIQFYRWPIFYVSDIQKGSQFYNDATAPRDQNPLDPNKQLMDPSWWSEQINDASPWGTSYTPLSGAAHLFQTHFFTLTDPNANPGLGTGTGIVWDQSSTNASPFHGRRAYYSKYLILSGGPDKIPGVPVFDDQYWKALSDSLPSGGSITNVPSVGGNAPNFSPTLAAFRVECQAAPESPLRSGDVYMSPSKTDPISGAILEAGHDDITNHNIQAPGGATR
ncbi:MAG: hypothetical protein NVSMB9_27860 [Isosphaeraceae bacterium]